MSVDIPMHKLTQRLKAVLPTLSETHMPNFVAIGARYVILLSVVKKISWEAAKHMPNNK